MPFSVLSSLPSLHPVPVATSTGRRLSIVAKPQPLERNHLFVNNIRFWSMVSIIAEHCIGSLEKFAPRQLHFFLIVCLKFGTIGFFLVAGFLMGERVDQCRPLDYFMRRANKIAPAWLFWFFVMAGVGVQSLLRARGFAHLSVAESMQALGSVAWNNFWRSAFWFVPNFLLCIAVLLIFRRYLYTLRLGLCLLAINLVYVVNIYALWFPSLHCEALFGFVFYLWLGNYVAHNFEKADQLFSKISFTGAIILASVTCVLAYGETCWLEHLANPDPTNTLRFSNQLFSLSVALVLFKLKRLTWPQFVDVRRHTFGLYLTHMFAMSAGWTCLRSIHRHVGSRFPVSGADYLALVVGYFVATYLVSLAITEAIAKISSLRWMVGLSSQKSVPRIDTSLFRSQVHSKT